MMYTWNKYHIVYVSYILIKKNFLKALQVQIDTPVHIIPPQTYKQGHSELEERFSYYTSYGQDKLTT